MINMKIKPQTTILISIIIMLVGIVVTMSSGVWSTVSTKVPQKLKQSEFSQQYDPSDIRGSYTFTEISSLYGVPIEDISAAFGVDIKSASTFKCKDLEAAYSGLPNEIGTGSVRLFTALYCGLPYDITEDIYLTSNAVEILKQKSNLSNEQVAYLESHTVNIK